MNPFLVCAATAIIAASVLGVQPAVSQASPGPRIGVSQVNVTAVQHTPTRDLRGVVDSASKHSGAGAGAILGFAIGFGGSYAFGTGLPFSDKVIMGLFLAAIGYFIGY